MKKYIIEEPKLAALLTQKMVDLMADSAEIFSELNPEYSLKIELDDEERILVGKLQNGEISSDAIPKELKDKIDIITKELDKIDKAEKEGKVNMNIFSVEDVRKRLTFTDEEILSFLYGSEEKQLPES